MRYKTKQIFIFFYLLIFIGIVHSSNSFSLMIKENATIQLLRRSWKDVIINVPKEYIGPKFLTLSRKAASGERVRTAPITLTYPEFKPWPEDWKQRQRQGDKSLVYMLIRAGWKHGIRDYANSKTDINTPDISDYPIAKDDEYGLKHFVSTKNSAEAYYYKASGEGIDDVFIECSLINKMCHYYMQASNIYAEFSVDINLLPKWKEVVSDFSGFLSKLYVKEVKWTPPTLGKWPDPVDVKIYESGKNQTLPWTDALRFKVPLKYFPKDLNEKTSVEVPLKDGMQRFYLKYPSMEPAEEQELDEPDSPDNFPVNIYITNRPNLHFINEKKCSQLRKDGSEIPIDNCFAFGMSELGSEYGLEHYFRSYPVTENHIYFLDGKENLENYVLIKCEYYKFRKENLKMGESCKMSVVQKPNIWIDIGFSGTHIDKWKDILDKSIKLIKSVKN